MLVENLGMFLKSSRMLTQNPGVLIQCRFYTVEVVVYHFEHRRHTFDDDVANVCYILLGQRHSSGIVAARPSSVYATLR
ncbi:MAG TPA: hypothetical protein VJP80_05390 [Candidatus Saccharimonadales bacterium]|nr:hypothetical protein [Candidatus Saccharimonadales bacterium]